MRLAFALIGLLAAAGRAAPAKEEGKAKFMLTDVHVGAASVGAGTVFRMPTVFSRQAAIIPVPADLRDAPAEPRRKTPARRLKTRPKP